MILELQFVTYIHSCFGHCHVTIPNKEILSLFGHCHVTCTFMQPLSFFGRFLQRKEFFAFRNNLIRKRLNKLMAAVMLQVIPSLYAKYSKNSIFIFAVTYEKYIVSKEYCIAHQDAKLCFLPKCSYPFYCWVTLMSYYRNWTHCVPHINMWTVSIHCSSMDSIEILLSRMVKCLIMCK